MNISFKQAHSTNYSKGRTSPVQWIVVHYTANKGDTASGNASYFSREANIRASANYFVDENEIWQSVKDTDTAWHCGSETGYYYNACRNSNSIGIEMCSDWQNGAYVITEATMLRTVELVKYLMDKYNVPIERVCRHYDVTHKSCPEPWVRNPALWTNFKKRLGEEDLTEAQTRNVAKEITDQAIEEYSTKYKKLENVPEYYYDAVKKVIDKGALEGTGNGIELSEDLARILTILDRLGKLD